MYGDRPLPGDGASWDNWAPPRVNKHAKEQQAKIDEGKEQETMEESTEDIVDVPVPPSTTVLGKVPWGPVLAGLLGTSFYRDITASTAANWLFAGALGLTAAKAVDEAVLDGKVSWDTFQARVYADADPLLTAAAFGGSILAWSVLRTPTSNLAVGLASVPAGVIAYQRVADVVAWVQGAEKWVEHKLQSLPHIPGL
jgi:hypothetical protein